MKSSKVRKLCTKAFLQKSFDYALCLLPCWNPLEANLSKLKLKREDVSFSFVQCLLQSCFRSKLKEFWSGNELSYLFLPLLIYRLLYGGPALRKLGKPFSWLIHLLLGYRHTLLFRCTWPKWCGELAGKRLFPVCGLSPTYKASYIKKRLVCVCVLLLCGGEGEERKGGQKYACACYFAWEWDQDFSNTRSWGNLLS